MKRKRAAADGARAVPVPEPVPEPVPVPVPAWMAILADDAAFIAAAVRLPSVDKTLRQKARGLLWQAWALVQPPEPEPDADAVATPPPEPSEILALLRTLMQLRIDLGDAGAGIRPLRQVLLRKPHPERPLPIEAARATERTARGVLGHFAVRVGIDAKRLAWFEARCSEQDPTRVAKVRPPDEKDNRQPLELLVKKGQSRFS